MALPSIEARENVHFLCGDISNLPISEILTMTAPAFAGTVSEQLADITAGKKLDAVIVLPDQCGQCQDRYEEQERRYREADFDRFDPAFG
jgi:hypothetical protein